MPDPNPSLDRWIFASVSDHFNTSLSPNIPLYIEGQFRKNQGEKDSAELRIVGPTYFHQISDCWVVEINIDILLQSAMDDCNYHRIWKDIGFAREAMQPCIPVFKYGSETGDDDSFFGNLRRFAPRGRTGEEIRTTPFGQIGPEVNLYQATVDAFYRMEFQSQ